MHTHNSFVQFVQLQVSFIKYDLCQPRCLHIPCVVAINLLLFLSKERLRLLMFARQHLHAFTSDSLHDSFSSHELIARAASQSGKSFVQTLPVCSTHTHTHRSHTHNLTLRQARQHCNQQCLQCGLITTVVTTGQFQMAEIATGEPYNEYLVFVIEQHYLLTSYEFI